MKVPVIGGTWPLSCQPVRRNRPFDQRRLISNASGTDQPFIQTHLRGESEGAVYVASSSLFRVIRSMQKISLRHACQETCRSPAPATTTTPHTRAHTHAHAHTTVLALCCRIQTNRVNCQKTWHDLSDSLSINCEWDWRAFRFSAPSAPPAHSVTPGALNPLQIITLGGVSTLQDRAKKAWLWSWPVLRVLALLNHPSQG